MEQIRSNECAFGPYSVRADEQVLRFRGSPIALAPKVVATLLPFFEEPGRVISKGELMERIWPDAFVEEANLTQNIYVLRRLFEEHQSGVRIENVPKRGYRLLTAAKVAQLVPAVQPPAPVRSFGFAARVFVGALGLLLAVLAYASPRLFDRQPPATNPYQLSASSLQQYLLGKYYLNRGTDSDLRRAIAQFSILAGQNPRSALGYAGLAEGYTSRTFFTGDRVEQARLSARAIALARKAVSVEGNSPEAYAALGAVDSSIERDDAAAARAFDEALRLDPDNIDALAWYGTELMNQGRAAEARTMFKHAMALDPSVPGLVASVAWADFLLRDYSEAAAFSKQLLRAHHLETMARITLASADVEMGNYADALPEIRKLEHQAGAATQAVALLSQIDTMRGRRNAALAVLGRLEARADFERIDSWDILAVAAAYARLGHADTAFVWLDRVQASERPQLARDPRFDPLRADRRFSAWLSG
ncbi:MAG: winged helix-turn-helix domain-containing protein [Candidatus Baltobacteraceae bacterium]